MLYVCYMYVICKLYVRYMYVIGMLYVCYMYVIGMLYVCYMFLFWAKAQNGISQKRKLSLKGFPRGKQPVCKMVKWKFYWVRRVMGILEECEPFEMCGFTQKGFWHWASITPKGVRKNFVALARQVKMKNRNWLKWRIVMWTLWRVYPVWTRLLDNSANLLWNPRAVFLILIG